MTKENKENYHHGDLRTALINATIEMITEQGIEKITMRSLSDWVGVSRTAAYRHFDNKTDLLSATAIEGFQRFGHLLKTVRCDRAHDIHQRFKNMGQAYIQFAVENPAYYQLMFGGVIGQKDDALRLAGNSAFDELLAMLETLYQEFAITNDDVRLQALYIWSTMHGLGSLIIDNKLDPNDDLTDVMIFFGQQIQNSIQPAI